VNLAYLKLVDQKDRVWADRNHFFHFSSKVMHHVLVDMARREDALKRPGKWISIPLKDDYTYTDCAADEILDISRAIERLRAINPRTASRLVSSGVSPHGRNSAAHRHSARRARSCKSWY
jgi:hypothetical protein